MRPHLYILDANGDPQPVPDVLIWAEWFQTAGTERIIQQTDIADDVRVSTVFLGIDHNYGAEGPPLLWETMIFGGPLSHFTDRYASSEAAAVGHVEAVARARAFTMSPRSRGDPHPPGDHAELLQHPEEQDQPED